MFIAYQTDRNRIRAVSQALRRAFDILREIVLQFTFGLRIEESGALLLILHCSTTVGVNRVIFASEKSQEAGFRVFLANDLHRKALKSICEWRSAMICEYLRILQRNW
jgi:hypothetical protein